MLSGATGHVYGSAYTWRLGKGWEDKIDTPGAIQRKRCSAPTFLMMS
jgi:hypothetical protein